MQKKLRGHRVKSTTYGVKVPSPLKNGMPDSTLRDVSSLASVGNAANHRQTNSVDDVHVAFLRRKKPQNSSSFCGLISSFGKSCAKVAITSSASSSIVSSARSWMGSEFVEAEATEKRTVLAGQDLHDE